MTVRQAIFNCLTALTVLAVLLQFAIDPSIENVAASCIVMASALTVLFYLRGTSALERHPLSSIAIFGFCVATQLGALLVQTAARTSLAMSLYTPLYTFGTLAFYQLIAVSMHAVYGFFTIRRGPDRGLLRGVMRWAGIYRVPSCGTLWYMGCVGLPTMLLWNHEGVVGRIVAGFNFLAWAPFLIPIYASEVGESYCNAPLNRMLLVPYTGAFALLGLALNARGIMFSGIATIGLLYLLRGMRSDLPLTGRALTRLGVLALILLAVSGPVSDLTTSMVIARQMRGKVSAVTMIRTTLRIWRQPGVIAAYRASSETAARFSSYDEHYIANPMLGRLVETKFYDTAFHFGSTLTTDDARARLRDISVKLAWASFPTPVLRALGISIDKSDLDFSMGDYMAYLSRGIPLGGRKTGNMFAQGIVLFGPLFPFLYAVICLLLYGAMDLLTVRPANGAARLSAVAMLQAWHFFMSGITFESVQKVFLFFVRTLWQMLLIYVLVFTPARLLGRASLPTRDPSVPMWRQSTSPR
ncbi:MAG TPA: hypothetical protein VKP66_15640 [Steroidobacteraceae bacterium]|nr:hypothetical protein [Steroidobacteraceae bacterium]